MMIGVARDSETRWRCSQSTRDPVAAPTDVVDAAAGREIARAVTAARVPCLISARLTASRPTWRVPGRTPGSHSDHARSAVRRGGGAEHRWRTSRFPVLSEIFDNGGVLVVS